MINQPINPKTEITFLFPDEIIAIQTRKISMLQKECDLLWEECDQLRDDKEQLSLERQGYRTAFLTLLWFFGIVALIWLIGPLG